jgi:quinol-cytochrome oxidoreductase complex cytochrome b subunit
MFDLCNPVIFALFIAVLTLVLKFLDNKISKKPIERNEYLKTFMFIFITSTIVLFIYDSLIITKNDVEIYTGNPNF